MQEYTFIPLSIDFEKGPFLEKGRGAIEQSIDSILDLIVFTPKGEFSADPEFGFEYWNHEFSNVDVREFNNSYLGMMTGSKLMNDVSKKLCEGSLRESILNYEPRLINPDVKIELAVNERLRGGRHLSKYEMKIIIKGEIYDGLGVSRPYEKRFSFMVEPTIRKY